MSQRINNKMNKSFLGIFDSTTATSTKMSTTTQQTTTKSTRPIYYVETDFSEVIDEIDSIEIFLLIITVLISLAVIIKIINLCKKGYKIHNERIITRHQNSSERL